MDLKIKAVSPLIGDTIPTPFFATDGSAAMDLHACLEESVTIPPHGRVMIPSGIAIALPSPDLVALIFGRSGLGAKHGVAPSNCVGVVDSDYRGELMIALQNASEESYTITPGDRIAQMMITPILRPNLQWTGTLPESSRGTGGFGSTGQ